MKLTPELRNIIYEHALGPRLYPVSTTRNYASSNRLSRLYSPSSSVHWGFGFPNVQDWKGDNARRRCPGPHTDGLYATTADYSIHEPNLNLLRVSKLINEEAVKVGWESTRKSFYSAHQLVSVLNAGYTPQFNWLNKVILDFTMVDWFRFLGVSTTLSFSINPTRLFGPLLNGSRFTQLSNLQIWFRSPYDGYKYLPWSSDFMPQGHTCCQRTMVDWIMTFAWPFIFRIHKVIVGGAVKRGSKRMWDDMLADPLRVKEQFDHVQEEVVILNTLPLLL